MRFFYLLYIFFYFMFLRVFFICCMHIILTLTPYTRTHLDRCTISPASAMLSTARMDFYWNKMKARFETQKEHVSYCAATAGKGWVHPGDQPQETVEQMQ